MGHSQSYTFSIEGMSCASCVGRVDKALRAADGVTDVAVNMASETAEVWLSSSDVIGAVYETLQKTGYPVRVATISLSIEDMTCASCVGRVEKALKAVPGVISVNVNLASETAQVKYLEKVATHAVLIRTASSAGYPAKIVGDQDRSISRNRKEAEAMHFKRRALIAALLALPVFVLEMGGHFVPVFHEFIGHKIGHQSSWYVQFFFTSLILFGPGLSFYRKGFPALFRAEPDMNSLVALGTSAAYIYSVVATFAAGLLPDEVLVVYYEPAAIIVVLILLGRFLEARSKGKTGAAIQKLLGFQAKTARVLRNGQFEDTPIEQIVVGDLLTIRPGERLAVDGEVVEGTSHIDESMITGEPVPVSKSAGDTVTGGTVNGVGVIQYRATRVGENTTLVQIIRMVEQAQSAKLPIQGLVDKITLWFVPAVIFLSLVTISTWLVFGPEPTLNFALVAGVSVLIIACPCAMGLATPTSIMVGTGRAAEMGILFRRGDALQTLSSIDVIAFDKTGTLTQGNPEMTDLILAPRFNRNEVLALVAAAEKNSEHPIGEAIVRAAAIENLALPDVTEVEVLPGYGITAKSGDKRIVIGADRLMTRENIDTTGLKSDERHLAEGGKTALFVAMNGKVAGLVGISDPLKPATPAAINALQNLGVRVVMITGDKRETAEAISRQIGISDIVAGVLPDGKVKALAALQEGGRKLAFVGDGINDAPALASADVGLAIGTGTDVAIESADVVLTSGDLRGIVNAFEISRLTMRNIRQNLFWAFGYNTALIPVAAGLLFPFFGVLLSPVLAAGAMAFSSVFVLSNALRLRFVKPVINEKVQLPQTNFGFVPATAK